MGSRQLPATDPNTEGAVLHNAVVAWNTQHLAQLIEQLRAEGHVMDEQDLRQISPLLRKHINSFGRYHFNLGRMKRQCQLNDN